jgi:hypothetical protein
MQTPDVYFEDDNVASLHAGFLWFKYIFSA